MRYKNVVQEPGTFAVLAKIDPFPLNLTILGCFFLIYFEAKKLKGPKMRFIPFYTFL